MTARILVTGSRDWDKPEVIRWALEEIRKEDFFADAILVHGAARGADKLARDGWRLSQDVVWEKHNGTGFAADRLKRVHEFALHWYRGDWPSVYHVAPREDYHGPGKRVRISTAVVPHTGAIGGHTYEDDGTRMVRSVIKHPSVRGGLHPTEKPGAVLAPLIEYSAPVGGVVLDVFAGSGSTGLTARQLRRHAVLIEGNEEYCERAAERLSVPDLFGGAA